MLWSMDVDWLDAIVEVTSSGGFGSGLSLTGISPTSADVQKYSDSFRAFQWNIDRQFETQRVLRPRAEKY